MIFLQIILRVTAYGSLMFYTPVEVFDMVPTSANPDPSSPLFYLPFLSGCCPRLINLPCGSDWGGEFACIHHVKKVLTAEVCFPQDFGKVIVVARIFRVIRFLRCLKIIIKLGAAMRASRKSAGQDKSRFENFEVVLDNSLFLLFNPILEMIRF